MRVGGNLEIALGDYPPLDEPFTAMLVTDRNTVVAFLYECLELQQKRGKEFYGFAISMPCGYEKQFQQGQDIPLEDLPCPCGRKDRYLIRYGKE